MRPDQGINDYLPPNGGIASRIAPTPSGFLHAGNAYNFILTYLLTRSASGVLHLRIDDYDLGRYRQEFVQNIFDVLDFLKIDYDKGPISVSDFERNFSFKVRAKRYEDVLEKLDEIYICECSRTTKNAYENGIYSKLLSHALQDSYPFSFLKGRLKTTSLGKIAVYSYKNPSSRKNFSNFSANALYPAELACIWSDFNFSSLKISDHAPPNKGILYCSASS